MAKIHNGFVNRKLENSLKDTGLNDFDLATTKMYKGVKPMFEQLGFVNSNFNKPDEQVYWKNIIPTEFDYLNLSGIEIRTIETDDVVGVSKGVKLPRQSYNEIFIDEDVEQVWDEGYYYPVLPQLNKFGVYEEEVDVNLYGGVNPPITNLDEQDDNLILNLNFDESDTDDILDKTDTMRASYNNDFELKLDEDLRLFNSTDMESDPIEKNNLEQAF